MASFIAYEFDLSRGERTGRTMVFDADNVCEAGEHLAYTLNLKSRGWRVSPSGKTVGKLTGDIGWHIVKEGTLSARMMRDSTRQRRTTAKRRLAGPKTDKRRDPKSLSAQGKAWLRRYREEGRSKELGANFGSLHISDQEIIRRLTVEDERKRLRGRRIAKRVTARRDPPGRTIYISRSQNLAALIDNAYGYLTSREASGLMRAIDDAEREGEDTRRAAVGYLREIGVTVRVTDGR